MLEHSQYASAHRVVDIGLDHSLDHCMKIGTQKVGAFRGENINGHGGTLCNDPFSGQEQLHEFPDAPTISTNPGGNLHGHPL